MVAYVVSYTKTIAGFLSAHFPFSNRVECHLQGFVRVRTCLRCPFVISNHVIRSGKHTALLVVYSIQVNY